MHHQWCRQHLHIYQNGSAITNYTDYVIDRVDDAPIDQIYRTSVDDEHVDKYEDDGNNEVDSLQESYAKILDQME